MKYLLVVAALTIVLAQAPADAECLAVKHTYEKLDALIAEHGGARQTLEGKAAQAYLDSINAVPPQTHLAGSLLVIWAHENVVALGLRRDDGLICPVGHVSADVNKKALKAALGEDI